MIEDYKDTSCYTYKVTMVIQILAQSKEIADLKLDQEGGFIAKRDVEFVKSTLIYKDGLDSEPNWTILGEDKED